jgi:small subunit ribosomal protein S15
MYLTKEIKEEIFSKNGKSAKNTGSAESQIALFTHRINFLTEHLKVHKKDYSTRLLDYLQKTEIKRYRAILAELNIRK